MGHTKSELAAKGGHGSFGAYPGAVCHLIPKVINNDSLVFRPEFIKPLTAFDQFRVFKGPMRQHPGPLVLYGTYGSPRMTVELKEDGICVGRHRVARIMRDNGLKALQKRRLKRTTDSEHKGPVAPNILDQDFTATAPNQKWGVDISYVWTAQGWL